MRQVIVDDGRTMKACPVQVAERIDQLAVRVQRLIVSHRSPEYFFEEKSDIAEDLRRIATEVLHG